LLFLLEVVMKRLGLVLSFSILALSSNAFAQTSGGNQGQTVKFNAAKTVNGPRVNFSKPAQNKLNGENFWAGTLANFQEAQADFCDTLDVKPTVDAAGKECSAKPLKDIKDRLVDFAATKRDSTEPNASCTISAEDCDCVELAKLPPPSNSGTGTTTQQTGTAGTSGSESKTSDQQDALLEEIF
jgi:hypothetical protein